MRKVPKTCQVLFGWPLTLNLKADNSGLGLPGARSYLEVCQSCNNSAFSKAPQCTVTSYMSTKGENMFDSEEEANII